MKKYQPSNGTEGMAFVDSFCDQCIHMHPDPLREPQCNILALTMIFDTKDDEYPDEWTYDQNGYPTCTKFIKFDWGSGPDWNDPNDPDGPNRPLYPDPNQLQMFPIWEGFYFGPGIIITPIAVTEEAFL